MADREKLRQKALAVRELIWMGHRMLVNDGFGKKRSAYIAAANPKIVLELLDEMDAADAKIVRLTSRGFENLHYENAQLKAKLKDIGNMCCEFVDFGEQQ